MPSWLFLSQLSRPHAISVLNFKKGRPRPVKKFEIKIDALKTMHNRKYLVWSTVFFLMIHHVYEVSPAFQLTEVVSKFMILGSGSECWSDAKLMRVASKSKLERSSSNRNPDDFSGAPLQLLMLRGGAQQAHRTQTKYDTFDQGQDDELSKASKLPDEVRPAARSIKPHLTFVIRARMTSSQKR